MHIRRQGRAMDVPPTGNLLASPSLATARTGPVRQPPGPTHDEQEDYVTTSQVRHQDLQWAGEVGLDELQLGRPSLAWQRRLSRLLVLLDLLLASVAAGAALLLRFGDTSTTTYKLLALLFPLGFVAMIAGARGYEGRFLGSGSEEYRRVTDGAVRYLAVTTITAFALRYELARGYVIIAFPLALLLLLSGRYVARQALHRARRQGRYNHRVIVVGRERSAAELIRQFRRESHAGLEVVGVCIDGSVAREVEGVPVLGTASAGIIDAITRSGADTVAVGAWSPLSQQDLRQLSWQLEGTDIDIVVAPSLADVAGPRIHIRPVAGLPLLHVEQPEFSGARRVVKGLFDRSVALLALILLLPLLIGIGLAVRLTSRGPALYTQVRVGRHGRAFTIYKFRSMRSGADNELEALREQNDAVDGVLFKMRADPRVTRLGAVLRRYSLDELPQLINVVLGQMSIVGPRPPLPNEVARYEQSVHRRLLVKPGLTGLWQISGRSNLTWEESVRLDLDYVENWSLPLDLIIVWKTVFTVLKRDGAY